MKENCILRVDELSKSFGTTQVFTGLNFQVHAGEIVALLGPSGCGKSTLLRMIAGLESVESGQILYPEDVSQSIGYVFQKPILYPHLDVEGNIALGFGKKVSRKERQRIIHDELTLVGLEGFSSRKIENLSGGEAQRITVVRALLNQPKLLLLDEPFSALDLGTRRKLATDTRDILRTKNTAAIHVTHDPEEAEIIADRVLLWGDITHSNE
ncbi:ATP-binding cassette domain-containing protein [Euryarchaeota archaeon]|nr:ATP-binding cassette domain-containing protein [Euryarchaeota archaeon]MDA9165986.1 ATP-binding cassette domain-containing protein [Candidatus Poseidoniaceae archaeon]MDA8546556.1 ATP-binding cassette domain-containing protein [Euryarchaeota archaeon]MDA8594358.1 ATP-binding cassette domain-containing protein [Euryarchaeota archaeon]MDA8690481.1 ATP-binding cassette domain-containing protein [Euryarchaeota archaeon]